MRRRLASAGDDIFGLSFIDVISCGLGASIILFLIFASLPHLGEQLTRSATPLAGARAVPSRGLQDVGYLASRVPVDILVRYTGAGAERLVPAWRGPAFQSEAVVGTDATSSFLYFEEGIMAGDQWLEFTLEGSLPAEAALLVEAQVFVGGLGQVCSMPLTAAALREDGATSVLTIRFESRELITTDLGVATCSTYGEPT